MAKLIICSRCKRERENGSMGLCKSCYITVWLQNNKDGRQKHSERVKSWRKRNRKKCNEIAMNFYWRNKEKWMEGHKRWLEKNKEKVRITEKRYRENNKEKIKLKYDEWRNSPNGKISNRMSCMKRRTFGNDTTQARLAIEENAEKFGIITCENCRKLAPLNYHIDHIVPISLGGSNKKENIQILCPDCNMKKHIRIIDYRVIEYLDEPHDLVY